MTVVKVGGSLLDWPELDPRLRAWLANGADTFALVPGGGPTTDIVRALDNHHGLGEERAHWLALRALTFNAHFLATLLPSTQVVTDRAAMAAAWQAGRTPILDVYAFLLADEERPGALEPSWAAGSDVVALRLAEVLEANRLILLKSVAVPQGMDWETLGRQGVVDAAFPPRVRASGLDVRIVNLRSSLTP